MKNIKEYNLEELKEELISLGEKSYRAEQIFKWIYKDRVKFLREREIVHYQRFGEGLRLCTDKLDSKNFYAFNPSFDKTKL